MNPDEALTRYPDVPRKIRVKSAIAVIRVFLWIALLLTLTIGPLIGYQSWVRLKYLQNSGARIEARIVDFYLSRGKSTSYIFALQFDRGDVVVNERRSVPSAIYDQYAGSPTVPVTVSQSDPYDFEVGPVDDAFIARRSHTWLAFILFGIVYAGGFVFALERVIQIESRLMVFGFPVVGEVISAELVGGKKQTIRLEYRYETSIGQRTGKVVGNGQLSDFVQGARVLILYGKDDDRKSKPASMFYFTELA